MFNDELAFEKALVDVLSSASWEKNIIRYPSEEDLIKNWADILFNNNKGIDELNGVPLTDSEMQQLISQINSLSTPYALNAFINGGHVSIVRDNPEDTLHFGKAVSLKIYDRLEIAGGKSRYQIAEQPRFKPRSDVFPSRRGDVMLLINGMPVIHIELKKSGIPLSQATNQIEKYSNEHVFTGLFSLVQIFVAMTPEETVYFANPGTGNKFNPLFFFHWEDFNNEPVNDWKQIANKLLSIPRAHEMIGFYTVADEADGVLKVMRSYQIYAAEKISDAVVKSSWDAKSSLGGFIWHTTGSGKTMTSFKSAQLISASDNADKVIFLMDRVELGTQSLDEYRGFADDHDDVQGTEDTEVLITKLKSNRTSDSLIVTSIQKMSNIRENSMKTADLALIRSKRLVFIVDECHRSTFGDMLKIIKATFPSAMYFGFTGTPIFDENMKHQTETSDLFGNELHHYTIADGIRDGNVLGFDPKKIITLNEKELRQKIGLKYANATDISEVMADEEKKKIFYHWVNDATPVEVDKEIPPSQYEEQQHRDRVVEDILSNWDILSVGSKFHAILATSSIKEALEYYKMLRASKLKVTAVFDPSDGNTAFSSEKLSGIAMVLEDYEKMFGNKFTIPAYAKFKKDAAHRLAHKEEYKHIDKEPDKQLDLVIVVDQLLTGFDSKWLNTLYLDKVLRYEGIIQAFSRTNRLFGSDKPFGNIRYYRYPNLMEERIADAFRLYSWDRETAVFVDKLEKNLLRINRFFEDIQDIFDSAKIVNFASLPPTVEDTAKFALTFIRLSSTIKAANIQGFSWEQSDYTFEHEGKPDTHVHVNLDEQTFNTLLMRYKELITRVPVDDEPPYDIDSSLIEINTERIDTDYMNAKFKKYLKQLELGNKKTVEETLEELHRSFASLSQEDQKYANLFLHDVQSGDIVVEDGKTIRDYITEYRVSAQNDQIHRLASDLGLDETKLRTLMNAHVTSANIDEYGRFTDLKATVDINKAHEYLEKRDGVSIPLRKVMGQVDVLLRTFILTGGNF